MNSAPEVNPASVDLTAFAVILDIRPAPVAAASPFPGSVWCSITELVERPRSFIPDASTDVLVVCDVGQRSGVAVRRLIDQGFTGARSLAGGTDAWRRSGRDVEAGGLTATDAARYDRHVRLPEVGLDGQLAVRSSVVTVVGVGGLGIPVVAYLAGAGVGTIRIVDDDLIELANLHRQPIYRSDDVGTRKVDAVSRFVAALNPAVRCEAVDRALDPANAEDLIAGSDVVVDATDRFDARYAINDAAHRIGATLVTGAVYRWEGQIAVLPPGGPCYRCAFPHDSTRDDLDCAITGVMGPVVGTIGAMQATEVIKVIASAGAPLTGSLLLYDGLTATFTKVRIGRRPDCPTCGDQIANAGNPSGLP